VAPFFYSDSAVLAPLVVDSAVPAALFVLTLLSDSLVDTDSAVVAPFFYTDSAVLAPLVVNSAVPAALFVLTQLSQLPYFELLQIKWSERNDECFQSSGR